MEYSNPLLWLTLFAFAVTLVWLVWTRYRPAVLAAPPLPQEAPSAEPAWLFCEEGTALDQKVRWFPVSPRGTTIIGSRPRASTPETTFVYLTAEDIREDHARISVDPATARYQVEALAGQVSHNNESVVPGQSVRLSDGDTLDLGSISRFRFTLTGPEES